MTRENRSVALVAIGDEIIAGACVDSNSGVMSARLSQEGWEVAGFYTLGDDEQQLAALLARLCRRHELVITTGGLGPTLDDVTRHAAAQAAGVELVSAPEALEQVRAAYRSVGREMPEANERQALIPQGASILFNAIGTAPGFCLAVEGALLAALPGPPPEMRRMFEDQLLPRLGELGPGGLELAQATCQLYLFGLSESVLAERAGDWMVRGGNPLMGVTAHAGVLTLRLRARSGDSPSARELLEARRSEVFERFREHCFSEEHGDLALVVGRRLIEEGITLSTAESCTGGLLAQRLTGISGISAIFREGFVTYSNHAKIERLGVAPELIEEHGAVSGPVAEAMARGARERAGSTLALAITGIAGPGGGSSEKPVGLVWFGVAAPEGTSAVERRFPARGREFVRHLAANWALDLLRRHLG